MNTKGFELRATLVAAAALFFVEPAAAGLAECAAIAESATRLACYDALAASSTQALATETVAPAAPRAVDEPALEHRVEAEANTLENPFGLTAYRPNYMLPLTYNSKKNVEPFKALYPDVEMDDVEAKFQISFKAKLWDVTDRLDLWAAYTQENWWQVYNNGEEESAPFRETNYQPELFASYATNVDLLGFHMPAVTLGFNHQSNGRSQLLSRSWNRIIAGALLERGNFVMNPRVWYRIPEDDEDDDNPRTDDFFGYGDLRLAYSWRNMTFASLLRNNLRTDDNKGAVQLDWSFPLNRRFKGYVQYFYGYGESLIDYDEKTNRIGIGVMMTDWL
jgi:phospholipase A1